MFCDARDTLHPFSVQGFVPAFYNVQSFEASSGLNQTAGVLYVYAEKEEESNSIRLAYDNGPFESFRSLGISK